MLAMMRTHKAFLEEIKDLLEENGAGHLFKALKELFYKYCILRGSWRNNKLVVDFQQEYKRDKVMEALHTMRADRTWPQNVDARTWPPGLGRQDLDARTWLPESGSQDVDARM